MTTLHTTTYGESETLQESAHYAQERATATQRAARDIQAATGLTPTQLERVMRSLAGEFGRMAAEPVKHDRPSHLQAPLLADLDNWASQLFASLVNLVDDVELSPAARLQWDMANKLLKEYSALQPIENAGKRRYGYAMALEALAASPVAVSTALRLLRSLLIEEAPALALLGGNTPASKAAYQEQLQRVCDDVDRALAAHREARAGETPQA